MIANPTFTRSISALGIFALALLVNRAASALEAFPNQMRGVWGNSRETCSILKSKGPAYLREDQPWLKITSTDVLGSTTGKFLRQTRAEMVNRAPAAFSFEIQTTNETKTIVDLTLSLDGKLYETIVGARASGKYLHCE